MTLYLALTCRMGHYSWPNLYFMIPKSWWSSTYHIVDWPTNSLKDWGFMLQHSVTLLSWTLLEIPLCHRFDAYFHLSFFCISVGAFFFFGGRGETGWRWCELGIETELLWHFSWFVTNDRLPFLSGLGKTTEILDGFSFLWLYIAMNWSHNGSHKFARLFCFKAIWISQALFSNCFMDAMLDDTLKFDSYASIASIFHKIYDLTDSVNFVWSISIFFTILIFWLWNSMNCCMNW